MRAGSVGARPGTDAGGQRDHRHRTGGHDQSCAQPPATRRAAARAASPAVRRAPRLAARHLRAGEQADGEHEHEEHQPEVARRSHDRRRTSRARAVDAARGEGPSARRCRRSRPRAPPSRRPRPSRSPVTAARCGSRTESMIRAAADCPNERHHDPAIRGRRRDRSPIRTAPAIRIAATPTGIRSTTGCWCANGADCSTQPRG